MAANAAWASRTRAARPASAVAANGALAAMGVSPARSDSRWARPHSPHAAVAAKWRSSRVQSMRTVGASVSSITSGWSAHSAAVSRAASTSAAAPINPSPARKPTASSVSCPGVRSVTESGRPPTRISSARSTAIAS